MWVQPHTIWIAYMVLYPLANTVNTSEVTKRACHQRHIQAPQQGHRCFTNTELCINKTGIQRQHHCTWLCMQDQICQVINFNSIGGYCLLGQGPCVSLERVVGFVTTSFSAKEPCLKWEQDYANDPYKPITFPKATDQSDLLILVRGIEGNNKIPGKGYLRSGYWYYSWQGNLKNFWFTEGQREFFTISTQCTTSWVPHDATSGNRLPTGAVIGGNLNGVPLYVARELTAHMTGHPEIHCPGYFNNIEGRGHMPYHVYDLVYKDVELLVIQEWNRLQIDLAIRQNQLQTFISIISLSILSGSVLNNGLSPNKF